mmetsp:Transcript_4481/g.8605  ORF Transcript_4481/g.8605 Transcript_4481/m.8605 type:complete len:109 (-) Transcript_4481:103-429(-)
MQDPASIVNVFTAVQNGLLEVTTTVQHLTVDMEYLIIIVVLVDICVTEDSIMEHAIDQMKQMKHNDMGTILPSLRSQVTVLVSRNWNNYIVKVSCLSDLLPDYILEKL